MVLVDTNVLLDVWKADRDWGEWSLSRLREYGSVAQLAINPIIYTEAASQFRSYEALDDGLSDLEIVYFEIPKPALYLASQAHMAHRRRGGAKQMVLPDFLIGAHAAVMGWPLITRDTRRYQQAYPRLQLVAPSLH